MRQTFTFYLVANANFRIHMISVYLAKARATQIELEIESFFHPMGYGYIGLPIVAMIIFL